MNSIVKKMFGDDLIRALNQMLDEDFACFEEYPRDKYNSIFLSEYLKELVRNDISFKLVKTEDKYIVLLKDELHLH